MNAKQKLHQSNLALWAERFREQAASGLSIKAWCQSNNISLYTYNYWKHVDKEAYVDSILPEIVPISIPCTTLSTDESPLAAPVSSALCDSHNAIPDSMSIRFSDIQIEIGPRTSSETILEIIKAVQHA